GATMRISGEGEAGELGGPPGDLYVFIEVKQHETFVRHGDDLYLETTVPFVQAALGATIKIPTLDGPEVDLALKPGTQPGDIYTIRDKGMKRLRAGGHGSLNVGVKVEIPRKLSKEQEELLRRFAETTQDTVKKPSRAKKLFNF
ncbi:MAG: DnaJ C-terminal domain-containing protein, partial [Desulfomonilia bacterium]